MGQWHGGNCRSGGRLRDRPWPLDFLPILIHTSHMNKTTQPDLPLILADYTEFVIQQQRRWAAMRAEVAAGDEILTPAPETSQFGYWHISDRH